jgi:hypothetical protein|tara:strand:+ start:334 stop:804 length:471 start_codon:yes stop_codon:yes gene_type:complete
LSLFAIVPNEVIADHNLTLIETRVLIALYSYRDPKSTRPVWPGRGAISERCGYHPNVISNATTSLCRKGWIRKIRRGKKRSNVYEILGKDGLTDPVSFGESDLTDPVRCDLTEPVRSIGTDHLTDHNNRRANGNLAKSAAGRALLAEQRIAAKGNC